MLLRMDYLSNTVFQHLGAKKSTDKSIVEIRNIHIWNGSYSEDLAPVYILYSSQISEMDFSDTGKTWVLLCIEDVLLEKQYLKLNNVHMVLLPASCSVADAANTITSVFSKTSNSLDLFSQVLSAISHTEGKGDFSKSISKMLSCPVAMVDDSFNILSSNPFDLTEDQWSNHLAVKQKSTVQLPKKYNYEGFSISPLSQPVEHYEFEVLFPIYADNSTKTIEGAIYFLSPDLVLPTGFSEILRFTAHALSWVLWKHLRQSKSSPAAQNHMLIQALVDMLFGNIPDEDSLQKILSSSTYNINQDFVLIVIEASAAQYTNTSFDNIVAAFSEFFLDALTLCFSGDIITLLPAKYLQDENFVNLWSDYSQLLKENNCYAGLSTVFHSIDLYFIHHYIRALSAARIARETDTEKNYSTYNEESLFHIVADGPPPFNLKALCDPYLLEMIRHDEKYGTEYFYTLSCYWQLDRDNSRICKYMHIHKNTLYYRIAKIKTLLHQDIDAHSCFMQLNLSVAILEALGMIPRYRIIDDEARKKNWSLDYEPYS